MSYSGRFYVVWKGRQPGVYDNLEDAMEQVDNYPGAMFKSFSSSAEAAAAFRKKALAEEKLELGRLLMDVSSAAIPPDGKPDYFRFPEIDLKGWAVDASCMGNPGTMEYRGVELMTGREIFRVGPFKKSTNNIGEFLAIVHALALQNQTGEKYTIYSDSVTGMAWVRDRKVKTKLKRTADNEKSFQMMERALSWLNTHVGAAKPKIMKWQTERWGEIPADFGRK